MTAPGRVQNRRLLVAVHALACTPTQFVAGCTQGIEAAEVALESRHVGSRYMGPVGVDFSTVTGFALSRGSKTEAYTSTCKGVVGQAA